MAKKTEIDHKALIDMIKDGVELHEIKEKFGFKTKAQIDAAYANALMETGQVPKIEGIGKRKPKPVDMKATVNKRGSLIIPKKVIDSMKGVKVGNTFEVKKTTAGIQLKKIKAEKADKPAKS